ncbi:uncharacterized protein LOC143883221 [Tasmannia lanceolata]|uniref:uncharacterized protein LOC143883221 n=1 Tax=Tasmannia lanceolata TaxID=3420 RepID=UPI004063C07D
MTPPYRYSSTRMTTKHYLIPSYKISSRNSPRKPFPAHIPWISFPNAKSDYRETFYFPFPGKQVNRAQVKRIIFSQEIVFQKCFSREIPLKWRKRARKKIEETSSDQSPRPNPNPNPNPRSVKTQVPEVEIHLFRRGKGPIEVFKSSLGGWDRDQLEIMEILDKYNLKSLFAFNPASGRGVPIRFNPRNGKSLRPYADGSVIFIDGKPKDSLVKPISKILPSVAVLVLLITLLLRETPDWIKKSNFFGGTFPPWVLACMVIVFTRLRKRTRDILKKYGW